MIESRWATWEELLPYKEQLIDMELELMVKYHYPEKNISRSYPEQKVNNLEELMKDGSTFIWISTDGDRLLGYYLSYISTFIDKKRWNIRSIMFTDDARGKGLGTLAVNEGIKKARELNCYDSATEYVPWNKPMENLMRLNGYKVSRIEVVQEL